MSEESKNNIYLLNGLRNQSSLLTMVFSIFIGYSVFSMAHLRIAEWIGVIFGYFLLLVFTRAAIRGSGESMFKATNPDFIQSKDLKMRHLETSSNGYFDTLMNLSQMSIVFSLGVAITGVLHPFIMYVTCVILFLAVYTLIRISINHKVINHTDPWWGPEIGYQFVIASVSIWATYGLTYWLFGHSVS